jgi:hypothetical protein
MALRRRAPCDRRKLSAMGTWDIDAFDNDQALDWAAGLDEGGARYVEDALDAVLLGGHAYVECPDGCNAIAAAEILSRWSGNGGPSTAYTEGVDRWVASQVEAPPAPLLAKALRATERVTGPQSELAELWAESNSASAWAQCVGDLLARLRLPPRRR